MKWAVIALGNYDFEIEEFQTYDEAKAFYDGHSGIDSTINDIYLVEIKEHKEA